MFRYFVLLAIRSSVAYRLCQAPAGTGAPPGHPLTGLRRPLPAHA